MGAPRDGKLIPRSLALAILGAALLLRVLIPTGWMPVGGPDGIRIVLCTPAAMAEASPPAAHGMGHGDQQPHHDKHQKPGADQPCAFSGLAMASDVPLAIPASPLPIPTAPPSLASRHDVTVGHGLAAPPPPSTGPPAFV